MDILSQGGLTLGAPGNRLRTVHPVCDSLNQCLRSHQQVRVFLSLISPLQQILFVCSRTLQILLVRVQLNRTESNFSKKIFSALLAFEIIGGGRNRHITELLPLL